MAVNIINKIDCCGCTACESSCGHMAIALIADDEGFLYPKVDASKCTECGLCESACPIIARRKSMPEPDYRNIFAARIKDETLLMRSSSGGIFSALALAIIEAGGVVVGAVYDENMVVRHTFARTPGELAAMRGSKYSQSDLSGVFREIRQLLAKGQKVLFSGTPCQVEGLKLFLRKPFDNLYTIDIVCHAVPSPKIFGEYVDMVSEKCGDRLISLNMRDKAKAGWSHSFSYRYIFKDGRNILDTNKVSNWGRLFFSKLIDRPSCHDCLFTNYSRPGDITLADFWDDKHLRPELHSTNGTSLLIANTDKGVEMVEMISAMVDKWPITQAESWQPCLEHPTPASPRRSEFWEYYQANGFDKAYKKYFTDPLPIKIKKRIKAILRPVLLPVLKTLGLKK